MLVLLQSGKEGMGVIFGGGSQSTFGAGGAGGLLAKVTAVLVAVFLTTSLGYNILLKQQHLGGSSIMQGVQSMEPLEVPEPEQPAVTFEDEPAESGAAPEAPAQ